MNKIMRRASSIFIVLLILVTMQQSVFAYENESSPKAKAPWLGEVKTQSTNLNVRSKPSTSSTVVSSLKKGACVQIVGNSGSWWKVKYSRSGKTGYVSKKYIKVISHSYGYVKTKSSNLNLRNSKGKIITSIPKGTYLSIIPTCDFGAVKVVYGQTVGWVSSQYFKYR